MSSNRQMLQMLNAARPQAGSGQLRGRKMGEGSVPYASVAEEALGVSSAQRGLGAMGHELAPAGMSNAMDSGSGSKAGVNPQMHRHFLQETQAMQQNVTNNMSQQGVGAVQDLRQSLVGQNTAEQQAIQFREGKKMELLEAIGGAQYLMQLGAVAQSPALHQFLGDLATGAVQAERTMGSAKY